MDFSPGVIVLDTVLTLGTPELTGDETRRRHSGYPLDKTFVFDESETFVGPVSYTFLTLPLIFSLSISVPPSRSYKHHPTLSPLTGGAISKCLPHTQNAITFKRPQITVYF